MSPGFKIAGTSTRTASVTYN